MTLFVLGEVPVGAVNPAAVGLSAALTSSVGPALANVNAQIVGLTEAQLQLTLNPPSLATLLTQAQALVAAVQAAVLQGLPSIDVQLAAVAASLVTLQAQAAALQAGLDAAASLPLGATLAAAVYAGPAERMGVEVGAFFGSGVQGSGSAGSVVVLCLGAASADSVAALRTVFGVNV